MKKRTRQRLRRINLFERDRRRKNASVSGDPVTEELNIYTGKQSLTCVWTKNMYKLLQEWFLKIINFRVEMYRQIWWIPPEIKMLSDKTQILAFLFSTLFFESLVSVANLLYSYFSYFKRELKKINSYSINYYINKVIS